MRRIRDNAWLREMTSECDLSAHHLIYPMFVDERITSPEGLTHLPGQFRHTEDSAVETAKRCESAGIRAILLFGIPGKKDEVGSAAWDPDSIVARTVRRLRSETRLVVGCDVCLCGYTTAGHCGYVRNGRVDNDASLDALARISVAYAEAGADIVAPSDMMDGRVGRIRSELDSRGLASACIMSYSVKYASAFYGPFRETVGSSPAAGPGDRKGYQVDPRNIREAMREIEMDIQEGADIVMVKPALPSLDVVHEAKRRFDVPLAAFQVSGEYAMLASAAATGSLDRRDAVRECLTVIRRAGADIIITYFALEYAEG